MKKWKSSSEKKVIHRATGQVIDGSAKWKVSADKEMQVVVFN